MCQSRMCGRLAVSGCSLFFVFGLFAQEAVLSSITFIKEMLLPHVHVRAGDRLALDAALRVDAKGSHCHRIAGDESGSQARVARLSLDERREVREQVAQANSFDIRLAQKDYERVSDSVAPESRLRSATAFRRSAAVRMSGAPSRRSDSEMSLDDRTVWRLANESGSDVRKLFRLRVGGELADLPPGSGNNASGSNQLLSFGATVSTTSARRCVRDMLDSDLKCSFVLDATVFNARARRAAAADCTPGEKVDAQPLYVTSFAVVDKAGPTALPIASAVHEGRDADALYPFFVAAFEMLGWSEAEFAREFRVTVDFDQAQRNALALALSRACGQFDALLESAIPGDSGAELRATVAQMSVGALVRFNCFYDVQIPIFNVD